MKKLFLAGLLAGMTGIANATWYENNPDHCASIGFNVGVGGGNGTVTVKGGGVSADQDATGKDLAFVMDTRIPASDSVSFNAAVGATSSKQTASETTLLLGQEAKSSALTFTVGVRFYLGNDRARTQSAAVHNAPPPSSGWVDSSKSMSDEQLTNEMKNRGLISK